MKRRDCLRGLAALGAGTALGGCSALRPREPLNFVLVHGAWHGSWCWDQLTPLLRAQGHRVTAIDLPGHGADRTPVTQITLASYVESVIAALEASREPVVLVGHSLGGMTISQAAEERPEQIRSLVFLSAFVMADGETAVSTRADPGNKVTPVLLIDFRSGTKVPLQTRLDVAKPQDVKLAFYEDCDESDVRSALARLGPEPFAPMSEKLRLTPERFGRVDKVYIFCSRDNAILPATQRAYFSKWPMRAGIMLESGHSPFLSMPGRLSRVLGEEIVAAR
jgi:pimeloyl-ACP methyl ester carboxylesterase